MIYIKKYRYKPLYKKLLNLKKNVQNRKKLLNFKKQKWERFNFYLKNQSKFSKRNNYYKIFDQYSYYNSKFSNYFSRKFKYNLQTKQRLSFFYGGLSERYLRFIHKQSVQKNKRSHVNLNSKFFFIELLESRLDSVLLRSHFVLSIRNARQLISHGHVLVNGKVVKKKSLLLKKGDIITFSPQVYSLLILNVANSELWPIPPKYLEINYRIFSIILVNDIKYTNIATNFSFWLDLNTVLKYYEN